MKTSTLLWFWLFSAVYLAIYVSNRLGCRFPSLIQFYLNDLLAIPVVATLGLWLMKFGLEESNFTLKKWHLVYMVSLFSVAFELLLPLCMERYTADILDVLMYVLGSLFFWKVMNK